jgi:broad specificity phosphatase PhoE
MDNLVVYVRHAESESNLILHDNKNKSLTKSQENIINSHNDPDITSLGIEQSISTSICILNKIKEMDITTIDVWISPYQRAQDTASYFIELCQKERIQINIKTVVELQEYTSMKKTISDEQKKIGMMIHETKDIFIEQIIKFNDILKINLKEQTKGNILIIFGHSLFFSNLISYHVNHEQFKPKEISSLQLPNCSISCENYDFNQLRWNTYVIGNITHLSKNIVTGEHVPFGFV